MRKGFKDRNVWAAVLASVLLVLLLAVPGVYGAGGIDTERACGVTFKLDGQYSELEALTIPVSLYRVASVGVDGRYTPLESFTGLDLSAVDSETTAEEWARMAAQASQDKGTAAPAASTEIREGTAQVDGLGAGMYLVEAGSVQTARYTYDFIPYLLALPGNYYAATGSDEWVYDVESALKPEQQIRYGSLAIEKNLDDYNATLGGATCIFTVEALLDGEVVYSDAVSLVFDEAGRKTVTADGIPAGAQVTVREVYAGASYQVVGDDVQTAEIIADDTASARFGNTYSGSPNTGSSIVNHYTYRGDGIWNDPVQMTDSTQSGQE